MLNVYGMPRLFTSNPYSLDAIFDYLDFITDFGGFDTSKVEPGGFLRTSILSHLTRYTTDHPGTMRHGKSLEEVLDLWIVARAAHA